MDKLEMLKYVDYTQLRAYAAWEDIKKLCDEAIEYNTASVCVPPCYVKRIHERYGDKINICTVIGFPLGYSSAESKAEECRTALADGADEFDMVINISDVKNKEFDKIEREISILKKAIGEKILKVIIETCYLTDEEKIILCEVVTRTGADYIKTSTGFGSGGAALEDIKLFKKHLGSNIKIKAAGGIKTLEDIEKFILEGCSRIGSSSAVELVKKEAAK
jgi:deoxyribose-phosphate aldolase